MLRQNLELWVHQVLDRVIAGQPVEDDRVELKAEWPDPKRAASRLAGHANASRGQQILWLIGVDEKQRAIVGTSANQLADWHAELARGFDDGLSPTLAVSLAIPRENTTVVALLFDTDRAPYVVQNPDGGQIGKWVPWRTATGTRAAGRTELLKILVPQIARPEIEVLSADLTVFSKTGDRSPDSCHWGLSARLYVTKKDQGLLTIPRHKSIVSVWWSGDGPPRFGVEMGFFGTWQQKAAGTSLVAASEDTIELRGSGSFGVQGSHTRPWDPHLEGLDATLTIELYFVELGEIVAVARGLRWRHDTKDERRSAVFGAWAT
jgi:hypothetical protein